MMLKQRVINFQNKKNEVPESPKWTDSMNLQRAFIDEFETPGSIKKD